MRLWKGKKSPVESNEQAKRNENEEECKIEMRSKEEEDDSNCSIDYVLVSVCDKELGKDKEKEKERNIFENNLIKKGLKLIVLGTTQDERFLKIHAPKDTLLHFCEIMKLRMPLKTNTKDEQLTEQFTMNSKYLFDVDNVDFITPEIKYMIINFILEKEKFDDDNENDKFGIMKLIIKGTYKAAYPLHDEVERKKLIDTWANPKKSCTWTQQPSERLKRYFGIKVALYYLWLEFYNIMLMIASVISIIYLIIGFCTFPVDLASSEICNAKDSYVLCPEYDKNCKFMKVYEKCSDSRFAHLMDNRFSVPYAILMALWSAIYLNMWNQYSSKIIYKWGAINNTFIDELPTQQYLESKEKYDKLWKTFPPLMLSFVVILFWIFIVMVIIVSLTFYRISLSTAEQLFGNYTSVFINVTGSIFDLISILVLNGIYEKVARKITEQEFHKTQKQFEESLMTKFYIFWFLNYYSAAFYIAFFKGRFNGNPTSYNRIFGYRQEECGPEGCIGELFIHICVILIGDMTYSNIIEYVVPYLKKRYRAKKIDVQENKDKPWLNDYKLLMWENMDIGLEYLEIVLQYGLVVLFIVAFPLAPVCALINNMFEIRLDAQKLIKNYRRPVAQDVKNIGLWIPIMNGIGKLAVITNACIIAFTTNFIPKLVYFFSTDQSKSYLDFTLSKFRTSDFDTQVCSKSSILKSIGECYYAGFYNPPDHANRYELSEMFWHILAARLIFVLFFQNFVNILMLLINYWIPEMPEKLRTKIIQESTRAQKIVIAEETKKLLLNRLN